MRFLNEVINLKMNEIKIRKKKIKFIKIYNIFYRKNYRNIDKFFSKGFLFGEVKNFSPLKGKISNKFDIFKVSEYYIKLNIHNISILTDKVYFGGELSYLPILKCKYNNLFLRKEFIINEYQIYETIISGGDYLLIITEMLSINRILKMTSKFNCVILENFNLRNIKKINNIYNKNIIYGLNNRNLITFKNIKLYKLVKYFDIKKKVISESNLNLKKIIFLKKLFNYFLIGEFLIKKNDTRDK
ncbi:hypothetical protein [Candidatus Vidania fulgoroideorum]